MPLTNEQRVEHLLLTYRDAIETLQTASDDSRGDAEHGRLLLMPNTYHGGRDIGAMTAAQLRAYRSGYERLEDALREMRRLGKQQSCEYTVTDRHGRPRKDEGGREITRTMGLHVAYWQVCENYLRCTWKIEHRPAQALTKDGKPRVNDRGQPVYQRDANGQPVRLPVRVAVRHPDVRPDKVRAGVQWLSGRMGDVWLPDEINQAVAA